MSNSSIFNVLTIIVITMNCIFSAIYLTNSFYYFNYLEVFFLSYYSIEVIIKIEAFSLYRKKNSYFRSGWNIFDFVITITSIIVFIVPFLSFNLTVFRVIRIINALNIKRLKRTFEGILASFGLMRQTALIIIGFIFLYSTIGQNLFHDLLKYQCFNPKNGKFLNKNF